jgi:C4-dicarboxylate-specific signal transduction histidine kinase
MSLRLSFALGATGILVLVLVLVVVAAELLYQRTQDAADESGRRDDLRLHAERAADEIQHQVERLTGDVLLLAHTPALQRASVSRSAVTQGAEGELAEDDESLEQTFLYLAYGRPSYLRARLIGVGSERRELVRIERRGSEMVAMPPRQLQSEAHRDSMQEVPSLHEGQVKLSRIDLSREPGAIARPQAQALRAVTPVTDGTGRAFALTVIDLDVQRVFDRITHQGPASQLYLLDEEGDLLYQPDPQKTRDPNLAGPNGLAQAFSDAASGIARLAPDTGRHFEVGTPGPARPAYAVKRSLVIPGGDPRHLTLVLVEGSTAEPLEVAAAHRGGLVAITAVTGLGALLMALLAHGLARPLRGLAKVSEAIARGNYAVEPPNSSIGELAQIGSALAHMIASLRDRDERPRELSQTLKQRVAERTGELEASCAALARERELLQSVLDHIGDGVVAVDTEGHFLLWNRRAEAILGMGPTERGASDWPTHYGLFRSPGGEPLAVKELPLMRALAGETVRNQELFVRNDHNLPGHWIAVDARPVMGASGLPEGAVAVLVNMDDARRLREMREKRAGELARIGRLALIGQIVDTTAHRLSQPLAAIANYAGAAIQLLGSGRLDPVQLEDILAQISSQAERGGETLEALRALTCRDSLRLAQMDLNTVVLSALELLSDRLQRQRIQVEHRLTPNLPLVFGQEMELQEAVIHLLMNATEALTDTPEDHRRLLVCTDFDPKRRRARILVGDSGPGVPAGLEERIFEPWVTTKTAALGLGLAVARNILYHHEGSVSLRSGGAGMTWFVIELPMEKSTDE